MLVLIGNQKGGCGKSTLALLLANFLAIEKRQPLTILDMDYQQSLFAKSQKAKILENDPFYEIVPAALENFPLMKKRLLKSPKDIILIDLPGKMDDDGLVPIFTSADLFLCPFAYDEFSVDSTVLFSMVVKKLNSRAQVLFIPNRIKTNVKYETKEQVQKVLRNFGTVLSEISDRIDFQRVSTVHTPETIRSVSYPVLSHIYDHFLKSD
ncbi:AAA family ATPase [Sphingobacterium sp. DR205]|uniref:nucleotide-binding protein n=1 Tax=Sphingobacterium sp. DR205 TaxID=2713573 RepID=UPI0013E47A68|nr:AAA family ATPase [Sphingobacterium sp. DR205]QIH35886.1 ParA family protein [Sphingobacterium sp. DR205]